MSNVNRIPATANRSPKTTYISLNNLLKKSEMNVRSIIFGEIMKKKTNKIKNINDLIIKMKKIYK